MKTLKVCLISLCLMVLTLLIGTVPQIIPIAKAPALGAPVVDSGVVNVNCTSAELTASTSVMSSNVSLVHFPAEVDLNNTTLTNATSVAVAFAETQSVLVYVFNNTDNSTARSNADAMTPSISSAFSTTFSWLSTDANGTLINVTYTGGGKSNLTLYAEAMIPQCLISDIGGFSLTFLPMTKNPSSALVVSATKYSGGFNWIYSMMTMYTRGFADGSSNHVVDILAAFNVISLAPSPYALIPAYMYLSTVNLDISSNTSVSYVSSVPAISSPPARGWKLTTSAPDSLEATFYFGNNDSAQSPLTLTFSGIVIPEFPAIPMLIAFVFAAAAVVAFRKRFQRLLNQHRLN